MKKHILFAIPSPNVIVDKQVCLNGKRLYLQKLYLQFLTLHVDKQKHFVYFWYAGRDIANTD